MGSCNSKAQGRDAIASRVRSDENFPSSKTSYIPSHISPPAYPMEHNISCCILRPWELDGEKSRGYRYTVYVNNNNLLNKRQQKAQDLILEYIQLYASIHGLTVWVKCLDYLSEGESDVDAEREKQFCKDMLAIDSRSELIRMWEHRPDDILPLPSMGGDKQSQQRRKTLKSSEQEIHDVIERIRNSRGLDDADAKSQIEPELVAALSRFNRGWKLEKFLVNKTQIFGKAPDIEAEGISKLQAQFFLQARAAYTSLDATEGSVPTVAVHILPDEIPSSVFNNIRNYMATTCTPLTKLVEETGKTVRQDRYTMQLISLCTARGKHGHQWQKLDDEKSGGMDIIDHMPLDIERLLSCGPGPFFGPKLMLGSINPDIDRFSKRKDTKSALYGEKCTKLTKEEMEECLCQMEPVSDQRTTRQVQPGEK
ncbi:unnamed protein product [Periconia digitata]|uniref:Uncharacterized protein n=1 Tax=Periconia digitata TaxID=1303443 RepID=A0A9W4UW92_9PLEO|nr:unnamed protein product [Periconia digitata]